MSERLTDDIRIECDRLHGVLVQRGIDSLILDAADAIVKLRAEPAKLKRGNPSLDESLNMGDGSYRP